MSDPKTIGRYEIVEELGHGAMGAVFLARDPSMDRTVALKTILSGVLASEQGDEFRQRFYREARAAGALAHPGIVPVFDVGEHDGVPFLVMEFVQGKTLADAMKKGDRLSMDRVCEIGQQIAEALGYAHRKGVIHRDIKPANILLTSRETHGVERPRITDFGVAKLAAGEITTTGQMLGTPAFMPPEQFTGAPIDGRTDLFSLGVILYWMATGEQPFPGETMTTVSYKIVHTDPIPPAKLNPVIPAQLDKLIVKCLAKSPADRYQSGEELAQALAEVRAGASPGSMKTTVPQASSAAADVEATLDPTPSLRPAPAAAPPKKAAASLSPKKRSAFVPILAASVLVAAAAAAGGWFLLQKHNQSSVQQPAPPQEASTPQQPVAVAQPQPIPDTRPESQPVASQAKRQSKITAPAGKPASAPTSPQASGPAPTVAAAAPTPAASAPLPRIASVTFNPKTLDPKLNARLKLDLNHFPPAAAFTVEMNGRLLYKGTAENKADYDSLYVPPGVHEFRIVVSAGGVQRTSNTVSLELLAKKHFTLKAELRPQPTATALLPATQVIASLKMDRFQF